MNRDTLTEEAKIYLAKFNEYNEREMEYVAGDIAGFALSLFQWRRIEDGGLPEIEGRYLVRLQDGSYGVYRFGDKGSHVRWSKKPYAVIAYIPYPIPEYEEKENENN